MTSFYKSACKLGQLPAFLVCLFFLGTQHSWGQTPVQLTTTAYSQTFDGIGSTATVNLPTGFVFSSEATPSYDGAGNYATTSVVANGNNFTAGGTYNFAAGTTSSDRAIGFLASGSYMPPRHILLAVQNTTGAVIQDLTIGFAIEKYRTNTRAYEWKFFTGTDGKTWTPQTAGDQGFEGAANTYHYPPLSTPKQLLLTGVNIAPNATFYLRWSYQSAETLVTNAQGIGLDDVTLTATLEGGVPPTPTAAIATTASAFNSPYCVTTAAGSAPFDVAFTTSGTFTGTFNVQLSDALGGFSANLSESIIGSGSSSPIAAAIPAGTPSGTKYRVRVVSDAPATAGTNNGTDLTISLASDNNTVTVAPSAAQTVTTTGTGATLTATAAANATFTWLYSASAAGPFTSAISGATAATYALRGANFPGVGTYYLVARAALTTDCGTATGESAPLMVTVTAPPTTPVLTVSSAELPAFSNLTVGAGAPQKSFTVGGNNLTGSIIVTPPAGFEIRTGNNPFACCSIELQPTGGSVPSTIINVRFAPTAAQLYQAAIPVTSAGLPDQAVKVSGTGVEAVYPATVSTTAITELTSTSANTGGTIATDGGSAVTARGIVWATTVNPTLAVPTKTADGAGAGAFASAIPDLLPGTTYYVRAYATNGMGTAYGEERTFTTVAVPLAAEPTAPATLTASQETGTSMQLNLAGGNGQKRLVLARISSPVDAVPVDATTYTADAAFGKGTRLGTDSYVVYNGTDSNVTLTDLRPNTEYHFAVFTFNDNETPYAENYLTTTPGIASKATQAAPAALLLEENFAYEAGTALTTNGWSAHSGGTTNAIPVVAPGLGYESYGASNIGNAASLVGTGQDVNRQFAPVFAGTPVYVSFLVKVTSIGTTADYFFNLGQAAMGTNFKGRVFTRRGSSETKVQFGISGNGSTTTYTSEEYNVGDTYLLVVKYSFDEASSTSELFVNPAVSPEPTTPAAAVTETSGSPSDIGSIALRQGGGINYYRLLIDGIRVGNSYRVVRTGLICLEPVPAFTAPAGCAGSPVAFTDASTVVESNATYAWDVNSDGIVDYTTKGSISHTYPTAGTYKATLTITQGTCSATYTSQVTVNPRPEPTITATPANQVYTGGVAANLYLGYGPQSLTLTAAGGATYSWAGPAGLSATNTATPVFTATTPGVFVYTVTATNQAGCSATKSVTITVVEVRDGKKNPKILVCHNGRGIYVNPNEVESHLLGHKEQLGDCSNNALKATASASAVAATATAANVFEAYPNPFTERASIRFRLTETSKAQLVVYNAVGQLVATLYSGEVEKGRDYEFTLEGASLTAGIYTCRLTTDSKVETKRLVLAK